MRQGHHYLQRFLLALVLVGTAMFLTACASRPKPLDPTLPFNVSEVRVTTESMEDFGFADRLQQRLEATVGRATSDIGQTSTLRIVVLDRRWEARSIGFYNSRAQAVSLDLILIDAGTGQVLQTRALHATSMDRNSRRAEAALIGRLVNEIRSLLGLSGYAPHPVDGIKHEAALPIARPDALTDAAPLSADPLLNGTVTPTTPDLELAPDTRPVLDISRPLLANTPEVEEQLPARQPVASPDGPELPTSPPDINPVQVPAAGATDEPDEPCIVTLDNDCSDQGGR